MERFLSDGSLIFFMDYRVGSNPILHDEEGAYRYIRDTNHIVSHTVKGNPLYGSVVKWHGR